MDALGEAVRTRHARLARAGPMAEVLDDGRVELDSNRTETRTRPVR
jgi:hypothetical protein